VRIAATDFYSALTLLDLGVTPVGVIDYAPTSLLLLKPEYRPILASLPKVGTNQETNVEAVALLKPDLILGWTNNLKSYEHLKVVAPTAVYTYNNTEWHTFASQVAEAAGQTPAMNALIKRYQDRAAGIKQTYGATLARVKWAITSGGGATDWILPNPNSTNGMGALALAGAQLVPAQAALTAPAQLSYEQLNLLSDADAILVPSTPEGEPSTSQVPLLGNPLFQGLKAAQAKRLYALTYFNSGNYSGALGALDSFEAALKQL
jgi:iron complex transport system substrate-binding protein